VKIEARKKNGINWVEIKNNNERFIYIYIYIYIYKDKTKLKNYWRDPTWNLIN
jgi:hypothetical protein